MLCINVQLCGKICNFTNKTSFVNYCGKSFPELISFIFQSINLPRAFEVDRPDFQIPD